MRKRKPRERPGALDKYVIFSISIIVLYTIVAMVLFVYQGTEMDTLTTCVYGFFGGELVSSAVIQICKIRRNGHE